MSDSLADLLLGRETEKPSPFIADRSKLEQTANCPLQAHNYEKYQVAPPEQLIKVDENELVKVGDVIHKLVEEAFKFCIEEGSADALADYFQNEVPKIKRTDIQPKVIRAAKSVCNDLLYMPVDRLIGCEIQIDHVLMPEKITPKGMGEVRITTCLDLLYTSRDGTLVVGDWKTGYKRRSKEEAFDSFQAQNAVFILWQQPEYANVETIKFKFLETRWGGHVEAVFEKHKLIHHTMPDLTQEMAFQARIFEATKLMLSGCKEAWPEPKKCLWCDAIHHCTQLARNIQIVGEDSVKFGKSFMVVEALYRRYKEMGVEYTKSGKRLETELMVFENRPAKQKYNPKWYKKTVESREVKPPVGKTKKNKEKS